MVGEQAMAETRHLNARLGAALQIPLGDGPSAFCFATPHSGREQFFELVRALCAASGRPVFAVEAALSAQGINPGDLAPRDWAALAGAKGQVILAPGPAMWDAAAGARRICFLRDPRDVTIMAYLARPLDEARASIGEFLSGAALGAIADAFRAYLSPRRRDDWRLRFERAHDDWREIAVDLAAALELPLTDAQVREIADAAPVLAPNAPNLRIRDALVESLAELAGRPGEVEAALGFALAALGAPAQPPLWRDASPGEIERSIRRPPPSPPDGEAAPLTAGVGEPDPVLGYRLRANSAMEREIGGRRIRLETDRFARRLTLGQPEVGEKLAAFYGCSFTFGTTSNADETFCTLLQAKLPNWRIENHGVGGYSQSRNLIALERESRFNAAEFVAFCWIRDHLRRNVADIGWVQATSAVPASGGEAPRRSALPRAALDAKGELAMNAVRYPRGDLVGLDVAEYEPSAYYLDQVCFKLIERAHALVTGYGGHFFFVDLHGHVPPALAQMLQSAAIPVVKTLVRGPEHFATPTDPHPNALAHRIYAEKIHEYLLTQG